MPSTSTTPALIDNSDVGLDQLRLRANHVIGRLRPDLAGYPLTADQFDEKDG